MRENNISSVTEFHLLGFPVSNEVAQLLFFIISVVYILTISVNTIIFVIVINDKHLHKPMYVFIAGLSFLEIWYPSVTVPRLLWDLQTKQKSIPLSGCLTQFYFHLSCGATENFCLAVMAYDRFVAICNPLRYLTIMNPSACKKLLMGSWVCGSLVVVPPCLQISNLSFCGHNEIDHYYCDFAPLVKLSCSDISSVEKTVFISACFVILGCFIVILVSYAFIILTIMKFPLHSERQKAFSTCGTQLIVIFIFYGTTIFLFLRSNTGDFLHVNKILSVFPSIVVPFLNPIIYTLRNKEVKVSLKKTFRSIIISPKE
eukprot:XP_002937105.1 PREDICTED: olfactory receptor 6F1-like [Xenopus tropicalis]